MTTRVRTDRSRIEVFPVPGGFRLQRFDKYGRRVKSPTKVFTLRNNCRREALRICREELSRTLPVLSVEAEWQRPAVRRDEHGRFDRLARLAEHTVLTREGVGSTPTAITRDADEQTETVQGEATARG